MTVMWFEIFTTHQFWAGVGGTGVVGVLGTFLNNRFSDNRKFKHEDKKLGRQEDREDTTQAHKETREDKLREEQTLIAAADEFAQICSGILVDTIDTEGAFNTIRDLMNNVQGKDDTAVEKKIAHGQKVADAQKRIAAPHYRLKMTANSPAVLAASDRVVVAILAVARMTVEPFAVVMTQKVAADEMNNFAMVVRKELGKTEYTSDDSKKAVLSFLDTLQRQTDDFVEHARDEMKSAGFKTTPWDNYVRKTPKVPPTVI
ncbi:Uncharacterised protein [Mycolicibacterium tokaiense]|uniref:Uncharacterized protein n=2 Tax=Mycolicibacterium tokaiense TaxID=39695 RepID=A0A378TR15_9MYCO|nr:Uncharacterised protein [Mycolicibacterium tokaiense]